MKAYFACSIETLASDGTDGIDVSAVMRLHDFLEHWGLVNYLSQRPQASSSRRGDAFITFECFIKYGNQAFSACMTLG